jgi:hypothetical protein
MVYKKSDVDSSATKQNNPDSNQEEEGGESHE